ncbi:MAG TPA: molybdenum cofactor guanylyltransferase [Solirubrobacteraceae bacterium]
MTEPEAIVAVLAGGRGERLGGAKPTVALGGRALIRHPLVAAHDAGLEAVVVAKQGTRLPELSETVLQEPEQPRHPLCGVIAALEYATERSPAPAVVLLACDMPFLTGPLLRWLAELDGPAVAEVDGQLQPLLARCLPRDLPQLREALAAERSLRAAIAALEPRIIGELDLSPFGRPERLCFNVNDAGDLARAEDWLARAPG